MKKRRTKILALFLAATMTVGSPATAFTVSAEDWQSTEEIAGFEGAWDGTEESNSDFTVEESEATPETSSDAVEDSIDFFSSEDGLANEVSTEDAGETDEVAEAMAGLGEKTEYADGTYVPDDFSFNGGTGKVTITCPTIKIENGVIYGNILFSSKKYTQIKLNGETYPVLSTTDGSLFKIPVVLNQDMTISATTTAMTEAHDVEYVIKITQDTSKFNKAEEKADYTKVDEALAKVPSDLSIYTDETAKAVTEAVAAVQRDYDKSRQDEVDAMASKIEEAVAALVKKSVESVETELTVKNTTGMFKVEKAVLHKEGEETNLIITMSGTGYHYLYKGTYEDAVANGDNRTNWCTGNLVDSKYQFTIPVSEGETKLALVAISNSYLNKYEQGKNTLERAFYPRQAVIDYSGKTLTTGDYDHTIDLAVDNSVKMFKVNAATLHTIGGPNSNNYAETLQLIMGSDSFDKLYVGSAEEAATAENTIAISDCKADIIVKQNAMGGSVTVDYLDKNIVMSFHSRGNQKWYERVFNVSKTGKTLTITPVPVPATGITLDLTEQTVYTGESFTLTATVEPKNSTDKVTWSSDDEKIATVDSNGKVTGVKAGTTTITATAGAFNATCEVTVKSDTFSFKVTPMIYKGSGVPTKEAVDVEAVVTDEQGNAITGEVRTGDICFDKMDVHKTYTLTVSRKDHYVVASSSPYAPTGDFVYTANVSEANDGAIYKITFFKDELVSALAEVPEDLSIYEAGSAQKVAEAVKAADLEEKDISKRKEAAAAIIEALKGLVVVEDGEYVPEVTLGAGIGITDLRLIVKDGKMTAQFTDKAKSSGKLYMGSLKSTSKPADTDPNLILPDNNGETVINSNGVETYQYTIPVSGFSQEITFSFYRLATKKWKTQTIYFSASNLKKFVDVSEISLDKTEDILDAGKTLKLTATVNPENASYKNVFWKSDNEDVATVKDGVVTGVAEGTATITVSNGKVSAECKVAVHTFETLPAVDATCTETGLTEGIKCSVCQETLKEQKVIPALSHKEEVVPGKAATCTKTGLTDGLKCSVCQETLKEQKVIPALGHKEEIIPGKAATCTTTGWTEGKRCSQCGLILKSRKVIKATGHKEVVIPAVAATQGHTGLTEGKKCSVCGEILVAQKETPALPILVTKVGLSAKSSAKIAAGKKVQLVASVAPSNAANKAVTWKSSNKKVATVNANGLVTMKKNAGGKTVVITATAKDGSKVYGKIKLTCMKGTVKKITVSGKKTVKAGKSLTLKANVTASAKANKKVAWSSSNKKLASVSSKGVVKTFKGKKGTVKITAKALDGSGKKATFKIKIK